ncbi:MAG TPA: hypothetical protein VM099_09075 [Gemmatimonadaceae bacterium]|nr:hypothetical protein [Gemmatimonadaceae bacterium]
MTSQKDFKRVVRARMKKTGESYTSARAQITRKVAGTRAIAASVAPPPKTDLKDYAKVAGMSDAVIKEKTGCTWARWIKALDYHGAETMSHREIADLVSKTYKVPSWWTQTVTVGYERIKGLRARGQRRDGTYEATKSRTFNVPVEKLYHSWADSKKRKRWLGNATIRVRTATAPKSIRFGMEDGSIVAVGFYPKGKDKSSVAVQHPKLPDRETANRVKQLWSERLEALAGTLGD